MNIYSPSIITERMIEKFRPTRLAIKELAGVLYFCKSINKNINNYTGSGVVWKKRIKKYGKENIKTLWVSDWYYDAHEIQQVALHFSEENQIVESQLWANQKPENGLDGGMTSETAIERNKNPDYIKKKNASLEAASKNEVILERRRQGRFRPDVVEKHKEQTSRGIRSSKKAREARAKQIGPNAARFDSIIRTFYNSRTNEIFTGTQYDFRNTYKLNRTSVIAVIRGNQKTVGGWYLIS